MEIVNNLEEVNQPESTQPIQEEAIPTVLDQASFDDTWQRFYNHCYFNLQEAESQIRAMLTEQLVKQNENFDPVNDPRDKDLMGLHLQNQMSRHVRYMRGVINGGLVVAKELGKLHNLDVVGLTSVLEEINKLPDPDTFNQPQEEPTNE